MRSLILGALLAAGYANQVVGQQVSAPHLIFFPLITRQIPPPEWIGPGGGRILNLVIDPRNPSTLYAGTVDAGVFKSTDGGVSWFDSSHGLGEAFVQSLAIDPGNPAVLYAGVYKDKLYKTTDAGLTWFSSSSGIQAAAVIYAIAVDPTSSNRVYIGTRAEGTPSGSPDGYDWHGKLYASMDGGASWTVRLQNINGPYYLGNDWNDWIYSIAIVPKAPGTIFATSHEHGPFISTNFGKNWTQIVNGLSYDHTDQTGRSVAVDPKTISPATVFYGSWKKGLFKSNNDGSSWTAINSGLKTNPYVAVYPGSLVVDPTHPANVYFGDENGGVYKTANGGGSWSFAGLPKIPIYSLAVHPSASQTVFAGTQTDGLYQSLDGGTTWAHNLGGLHANQATGLIVDPTSPNRIFASVNGSGVFVSTDHGQTWGEYNRSLPDKSINGLVLNPGSPNQLFALTTSNGLYRIDTSAATPAWAKTGSSLPVAPASGPAFQPGHPFRLPDVEPELAPDAALLFPEVQAAVQANDPILVMQFAPSNPGLAYLGTKTRGLYQSSNGGATWSSMSFNGSPVTALAVDPGNPGLLYAVLNSDLNVRFYNGSSWTSTSLGASVYALAFSPQDPTTIYAATGKGIYRKTGAGNWTLIGLNGIQATALAGHPSRPGLILAGTTKGAFLSTDNGATWNQGPSLLAGLTVQTISFDPADPTLAYFATTTHDILRCVIP